ncbi:hypothetical protein KBD59_01135 [Candidatus Gracilibacteria bacterium]|nr:hypothetical protein [Candidatus Gracilibacteria bacterium]
MMHAIESEFVFIGRGDESFLENYSYELNNDPSGQAGKVFMALEIVNNQSEAEEIGELIFTTFRTHFYKHLDLDGYERFEESLKAVNAAIEDLKRQKATRFIGTLHMALATVVGENLYISVTGEAEVYLVRKRFVSAISEGLVEDPKFEGFLNIANGSLEEGDTVLLSSTRLMRYITKTELGKLLHVGGEGQIGNALQELHDYLKTEILGRAAATGLYIGEGVEVTEEMAAKMGRSSGVDAMDPGMFDDQRGPSMVTRMRDVVGQVFSKMRSKASKLPKVEEVMPSKETMGRVGGVVGNMFSSVGRVFGKVTDKLQHRSTFLGRFSRQRVLVVIVLLVVVLVGGVFWLQTSAGQREVIAAQQAKLNQAHDLISEATTFGQFDKAKASELLNAAEQQALAVLNSNYMRGEAVKVLDDINETRDSLDEIKRVKQPTVVADLTEKRQGAIALGLLALKEHIYSFEYNALYEIVLDKLQDPLTISSLQSVVMGTNYDEGDSLVFLTKTGKLIEFKDGRFLEVSTKDGIWKVGVDLKSYGERLYVLDSERNQIWRYTRKRDGFEAGEAYNQDADLKKAVSLAIDGSVYVLNNDATVIQLYQGKKQEYPLRKSPLVALKAPTKIYTALEMNYVFILEPSQKRVLLYRKDPRNGGAQYVSQYIFDNTGVLRDLIVKDNRLYVVDDTKVYYVNLSGLQEAE